MLGKIAVLATVQSALHAFRPKGYMETKSNYDVQ